ncbi:MAG: type II toxin-antitoxin system TacA family antitoxin [Actinomycetota bacterium]
MAVKSDRLEARVSPEQRARLEWAATIAGTSVSAFVVDAAVERADEVVSAQVSTTVPTDYFDRLLFALDRAESAPTLAKAARRVNRRPRIAAR